MLTPVLAGTGQITAGLAARRTAAASINLPTTVYGLSGWSSANVYFSAANGSPKTPGTWGVLYVAPTTPPGTLSVMTGQMITGPTRGWGIGMDSSRRPQVQMYDGGTLDSATQILICSPNAKTVYGVVGTYDGSNIRIYTDGGLMSAAPTAITTFTTPNSSDRLSIGRPYSGNFPTNVTILGMATSTAVMTEAQIVAWFDACALASDVASFASGTDFLYSVKQSAQSAPAPWPAAVGTQDLIKNGTITTNTITDASFGWNSDNSLSTRLYNQIRVMYWGDSITSGVGSTDSLGYRSILPTLVSADADFSLHGLSNFLSGSSIQDHSAGGSRDVDGYIGTGQMYHPQIAILLLGANNTGDDIVAGAAPAAYQALVEYAHGLEPRMRFVCCHLTPSTNGAQNTRINSINTALHDTVIPALQAQGIPIVECTATNTLSTSTDMSDSIHPDDSGYTKMAAAIYPKLRLAAGWPES